MEQLGDEDDDITNDVLMMAHDDDLSQTSQQMQLDNMLQM
jgi:hypothetical protein